MKPARTANFILAINLLLPVLALAAELPSWITSGATSDGKYEYVTCSHDGLDPEDARQIAESKCLASAAKLGGVTVHVREKTVQSTTGSDSSEVAEIVPLKKTLRCEWMNRYLEPLQSGYRVWLKCGVLKSAIVKTVDEAANPDSPKVKSLPYRRGLLTVGTVPPAERIIIGGANGERVIEPKSNLEQIEIREGDEWVLAKRHKFKDMRKELGNWEQGATVNVSLVLSPGI